MSKSHHMAKQVKKKMELHPRNKHKGRYDLQKLAKAHPELVNHIKVNSYGDESIDFFDPEAVKQLNTAILKHDYGVKKWNIPEGYLCPPIAGRADYIHYIADLLAETYNGVIPKGTKVRCLDIGVGANCIYPIVGRKEYDWQFVGTEIDAAAAKSAEAIIKANTLLKGKVEIRVQSNPDNSFMGIIGKDEKYDVTICNPPFHASLHAAQMGSLRKLKNLTGEKVEEVILNFGGQINELTCVGGEMRFVRQMIHQSRLFARQCCWFSTLISKHEHVETALNILQAIKCPVVRIIKMGQGNKVSRVVVWSFLSEAERKEWWEKKDM